MKRVCNDNNTKLQKAKKGYKKIYNNRRVLPKNYKKYTKIDKFNIYGVKNM